MCAPETFGRAAQPKSWKQFPDGWAMPWATHLRLNSAEPVTDSALDPAVVAAGERRGIRVRTLVFGVVMLVISIVTLITLTTAVRVDGAAIGLTLLLGAGAILVAGGAASAVREARGGPGAGR